MVPLSPETCTVGGLRGALFGVHGEGVVYGPFTSTGKGSGRYVSGRGAVFGMVHMIVDDAKVILIWFDSHSIKHHTLEAGPSPPQAATPTRFCTSSRTWLGKARRNSPKRQRLKAEVPESQSCLPA